MKKIANTILISALVIASTGGAYAAGNNARGGKNWTAEKSATIDRNRASNAGRGDGGERYYWGTWQFTLWGEDGPMDRDPGNSEGVNQACVSTLHPAYSDC